MDIGPVDKPIRDEWLEQLQHVTEQLLGMDVGLIRPAAAVPPEVTVVEELCGVGLFSAMAIVSGFGNIGRYSTTKRRRLHGPDVTSQSVG
jgi:hypothetical protein